MTVTDGKIRLDYKCVGMIMKSEEVTTFVLWCDNVKDDSED